MGLSARWAGGWPRPRQVPGEGGNGGPVTLGRTGRRLARLSRGVPRMIGDHCSP